MVRACTQLRLSDLVALQRSTLYDVTWVHDGNQVEKLVRCWESGMEWRWVRLRGWAVDSASAFGFALAFAVGHGFQEYSMIWRSDELFWVGCGCGTNMSVVCWMRCGGV